MVNHSERGKKRESDSMEEYRINQRRPYIGRRWRTCAGQRAVRGAEKGDQEIFHDVGIVVDGGPIRVSQAGPVNDDGAPVRLPSAGDDVSGHRPPLLHRADVGDGRDHEDGL